MAPLEPTDRKLNSDIVRRFFETFVTVAVHSSTSSSLGITRRRSTRMPSVVTAHRTSPRPAENSKLSGGT